MTNGHSATAIKNMQAKRRESEVKWEEGENGRQGGSNETEEGKEGVNVKEREAQGVNTEPRALTDIPSCIAMKLSPENQDRMHKTGNPVIHTSRPPTSGHTSHTHHLRVTTTLCR